MTISTYTSPLYIKDDIDDLITYKYINNDKVSKILLQLSHDLGNIHSLVRKVVDFEDGILDEDGLLGEYNLYRSRLSTQLIGGIE